MVVVLGVRLGGGKRGLIFVNIFLFGFKDWMLFLDLIIMLFFVIGIEDDFFEYKIWDFFKFFGKIKFLVVLYMIYCVFVNYEFCEGVE